MTRAATRPAHILTSTEAGAERMRNRARAELRRRRERAGHFHDLDGIGPETQAEIRALERRPR